MPEAQPLAFILMPFAAEFDDVYEHLIQTPLESAGFEVRRADSLLNQRSVLQDVIRGIADAALIVADVSGLNPNVLYELGLAHALGKRAVMITRNLEELPFDLRPYRANEYSIRFNEAGRIAETLTAVGEAVLNGSAQFSNPVQDFAPTALVESSQVNVSPTARQSGGTAASEGANDADEESDGVEDLGLLEYAELLQSAGDASVRVIGQIGESTAAIGDKMNNHTERLGRAQQNLGDKGAGVYLKILRDAAKDLDDYSGVLAPLNVEFRRSVTTTAEAATALARHRVVESDEDGEALAAEIESIREAEGEMAKAYDSVTEFAASLLALPHMDRVFTQSARRAAQLVNETAEITEVAQSEYARARQVLEERA